MQVPYGRSIYCILVPGGRGIVDLMSGSEHDRIIALQVMEQWQAV